MDRYPRGENSALVSLVGLALVVASSSAAVWWWSQGTWGNFSLINGILPYVIYSEHPPPDHGAQNGVAATTPDLAGRVAAAAAPHCQLGQKPEFSPSFGELERQVGEPMGTPVGCSYANSDTGDTLQQTSNGLAVYRPADQSLSFTDGWRHWELTAGKLRYWEGTQDSPPLTPTATPLDRVGEKLRVANTSGVGVALRSTPRTNARLPTALREGAHVTLVKRQGDWIQIRAPGGQVGWVPAQYLVPG